MNVTLNGSNNIVEVRRDDYDSEVLDFVVESGSSNAVKRVNVFSASSTTNRKSLDINNMNGVMKNSNNSNGDHANLNIFKQNFSNFNNGFKNDSLFNSNMQNHAESKMEI